MNTRHDVAVSARTLWTAGAIAFLGFVLWTIASRVVPDALLLFSAIVIAEGMRPLVALLVRKRFPQPLAILAIVIAVLAVLGAMAWLIIAPLAAQIASLIDDIPHFTAVARGYIGAYQQFLHNNAEAQQFLGQLPNRISAFLTSQIGVVLQAPITIVSVVANAFLVLLLVFFWLMASSELSAFALSFVPDADVARGRAVLDEMSAKIGGYLRGVLINMGVIGTISGIGVLALGVPYALLLAVVAGLTESIPIVGPLLGGSVAASVALLAKGPDKALQVVVLYAVIQQIEGNTLVPYVMNRVVALNPLAIIVALLLGTALLGIPGAVLSVPAAAVVQVLVVRVVAPNVRGRLARRG